MSFYICYRLDKYRMGEREPISHMNGSSWFHTLVLLWIIAIKKRLPQ